MEASQAKGEPTMNYLKKILVAMLASSKLMAWGGTSHNPTDPATWQDLQDQATVFNYSVNQAIAQSAAAHSQEFAAGTRITFKLGSSYEERLIKQQAQEIAELKAMMLKGAHS